MRGITESDLLMHRNNDRLDWDTRRAFDIVMRICPPKELNPWLPIADAPKDRDLILFYHTDLKEIGRFNKVSCGHKPTHYQELPADPE